MVLIKYRPPKREGLNFLVIDVTDPDYVAKVEKVFNITFGFYSLIISNLSIVRIMNSYIFEKIYVSP